MSTQHHKALMPARAPQRIVLLITQTAGFAVIFVPEQYCTAPVLKVIIMYSDKFHATPCGNVNRELIRRGSQQPGLRF